jgi:signal transduction histidine kinase
VERRPPHVRLAATRPIEVPPVSGADQLRTCVGLSIVALLIALGWLVTLRVWLVPSGWLSVLLLLVAVSLTSLLVAAALLVHHRHVTAVVTIAVSNWVISVAVTAIVPSALMMMPLIILFPTLLAVQHLDRARLAAMFGATIVVVAAAATAGRLQVGAGLERDAPAWVFDSFVVAFIPITAGLLAFLAWQNHVSLSAKAQALQESRARLVAATDRERRRIERNLHDGAQQRLVAAAVQLRVLDRLLTTRPDQTRALVAQLAEDLHDAGTELRDLAHGIYPPQLTEHGLAAALRDAALRCPLPTTVHTDGVGRYPPEIEISVYFCCLEALQNATKHAGDHATVTIDLHDRDGLSFDVHDTGRGCKPAAIHAGHGFTNMADRLGALGGTITIHAQPGTGIHLHGHIPRSVLGDPGPARPPTVLLDALAGFWTLASRLWSKARYDATERESAIGGLRALLGIAATSVLVALWTYLEIRSVWLLALAAGTALASLVLLHALHAVEQGRTEYAVLTAAIVMWAYAFFVTLLIPGTPHHSSLMTVTPVILAAPYVSRHRFQGIVVVTVAVAIAVAVASRVLPGAGIEQAAPAWLVNVVVISLVVVGTTLVLYLAWQHHVRLSAKAQALQESRARLVAATDRERRRIERNLHDGAQQRLVAAAVQLRVLDRLLTTRPDQTRALVAQLAEDLHDAGTELRDLAHGIYPPQLTEHGLAAALRDAALRCPLPTTVHTDGVGRYPPEIEISVYFCCLEALQNATKHAGDHATVTIDLHDRDGLSFEVHDTGRGCEPAAIHAGHGFTNMADRLGALGGTITIHAQPGTGIHLHGHMRSRSGSGMHVIDLTP